MKKIVYVDMDGVVADFDKAIKGYFPFINFMPKNKRSKKVDDICSKNKRIFSKLEPIPNAIESVSILATEYDIYFLSTPMWHLPESFMDKRIWLEKHFNKDISEKRLILTHRKDLAIGDYLIDDRLTNGSENFKGEFIHFGSDKYKNWDDVLNKLIWQKKKKHGE